MHTLLLCRRLVVPACVRCVLKTWFKCSVPHQTWFISFMSVGATIKNVHGWFCRHDCSKIHLDGPPKEVKGWGKKREKKMYWQSVSWRSESLDVCGLMVPHSASWNRCLHEKQMMSKTSRWLVCCLGHCCAYEGLLANFCSWQMKAP